MAGLIRAHDWSSTPLGPIEHWPQSLKTATGLLVASPVPMVMLWGAQGVMIYNDAYSVFAGRRHPQLLGANVREGWPEVADFNDNVMTVGLGGGTLAYKDQALTLDRNGTPEQVWMDLDYWPVPDENGAPAGVMATVVETTERKRLELRQAALLELDWALSDETDGDAVMLASSDLLGRILGVSRVGYGEIDAEAETIVIDHEWTEPGAASVVGHHHFRDYGSYVADLLQGQPVTIEDVARDTRTAANPRPLMAYGIRALMDVPIVEAGRVVAQVLVHSAVPRVWSADEIDLVKAFAGRTRAIAARRAAEEATRTSERELKRLADSLPLLVSFVDKDERYGFANQAYEGWFGLDADDLRGRQVREVVGESAYATLHPQMLRALAGERFSIEQNVLYRGNDPRFVRADFIPRRTVGGAVDGYYAVIQDISERRDAALRQQVLLELDDAVRDLTDPAEIAHASSGILAEALNVSRVGYGVMDTVAETVTIERDYNAPGVNSIAGVIRFRDFGDYIEDLSRGEVVVFDNAAQDPRVGDGGAALAGIRATALINLPLIEQGKVVALLFVNNATPRHWTAGEVALVREVAERVRTTTERARGTVALRQNEARLRFLDDLNIEVARLTDADAILEATTRMTARHLGADRCAYADMDEDQDGFTIRGDWAAPGLASIVGHYQLADFGVLAVQELGAGRPLIINDNLKEIAPEEAAAFQSLGVSATICMPLVKTGRLTALMAIHRRRPHVWTDEERATIREVTERSWAHIERVRADAALRASEVRYRALFEAMDEGFCVIEFIDGPMGPLSDYVHVEANAAYAANAGIPDVVGQKVREMVGAEAQEWIDLYKGVLDTGRSIRFEKELEETGRWLELAAFRVEPLGRNQVAVLFKDLTARRRAELALQTSEAELRTLNIDLEQRVAALAQDRSRTWQVSPDLIGVANDQGYFESANPAWETVLGWTNAEVTGRPLFDFLHPDDVARTQAVFVAAIERGEPAIRFENRYRTRAGDHRWISWVAVPEGGKIYASGRDVTEDRARAQERDRLWSLSSDMLARADYGGGMSAVNPAWTQVLGWSEHELLTNPYADIINPADVAATTAALAEIGETGKPTRFQNSILSKGGDWTPIDWIVAPEPDGVNFIAVGRDLTTDKAREAELQAAQEALRQSQKMEAVGQLTGGIAHDFNNLLAGISGSLELLGKRLREGRLNGMERYIDAAQGSAQRAASLTQRLLAFSRRQTLDPTPTDVNRLIAGMEDLIRRTVGPDVELEVVGAAGLWTTRADQPQLENALLNLCINARDAMAPDGGRLTIETANKWMDERAAGARDLTPGQYISLCVTDTGSGMTPEVQAQAFDPFFTTKPLGQGTGLGLSMIHGFARQSGGQVRIYSEVGKGTTMCLYFPRWFGGVENQVETADTPVAEGGHGETVLVIDDEETVRMLVVEVLSDAGYRVIDAPDGPSGLEILRSDARINLLVTDVGLPGGLNGRQVADAARETRPELKVLFITGYAENAAVGNGLLDAGMAVITKPFVMSELAIKVHDMIEG